MKSVLLAAAALSVIASSAFGQGVDPLVGTWKFNVGKSTYVGIPPVKSATHTWTMEGQTLTNTVEGVDGQGQPFKIVFRHIYDGMSHPTTGGPDYDSTIYHRIGNTENAVRFRQGKVVDIAQITIDPGKSYTVTSEGIVANGQQYHSVAVYERQ
jgi:hypothetical protein